MRIAESNDNTLEVKYNVVDGDIKIESVKLYALEKWLDMTKDHSLIEKEVYNLIIKDLETPLDDGGHGDQVDSVSVLRSAFDDVFGRIK